MAFTSTLTAVPLIAEMSDATPGLFNRAFSQLSDNIGTVNAGGVPFNIASGSTWASIGLTSNSNNSDYIRFTDSSAQRSTYRIGSNAGGTADGLNIWDESGNTMIASFSKQSIRFYQQVVGPVFDIGGALSNTLNAATFGTGSDSKETRIQAAINAASASNISRVYIPSSMLPYSASSISFIYPVQMTREGGNDTVYDWKAYGASGNSIADDTTAIQQASKACLSVGGRSFGPGGTYRITSPIDFTGTTNNCEFYGDTDLSTIILSRVTSGTTRGALSVKNTQATRAYVHFHDFELIGINDSKTIGLYMEWTSGFSLVERILILQFADGIRLANDSATKFHEVISENNLQNGITIGQDLANVSAPCNNTGLISGIYNGNGGIGVYVNGSRAFTMIGVDADSNTLGNIKWDTVIGGSIAGQYMEYANSLAGTPTAQLYLANCTGITVNGCSVSAFKFNGNAIVLVENCSAIELSGIAIELSAGGTQSAVGVDVTAGSTAVSVKSCSIRNTATGVRMSSAARVTIETVNFASNTNPVITNNSSSCVLVWKDATAAEITASSWGLASVVNYYQIDGTQNTIGMSKTFAVTPQWSDLSSAAKKNIITHILPGEQWKITNIYYATFVNFNAGGDRNMIIYDGTHIWSLITAATLKSQNNNAVWGSASLPLSASASDFLQPSTAGTDIYAQYNGGTTDYTSGGLTLYVVATRFA